MSVYIYLNLVTISITEKSQSMRKPVKKQSTKKAVIKNLLHDINDTT